MIEFWVLVAGQLLGWILTMPAVIWLAGWAVLASLVLGVLLWWERT